jgi:uncharacterized membrane protein
MFISSMILVVVSNVLYHIFQKTTPEDANPMLSLAITYSVAVLLCLILLPLFPLTTNLKESFRQLNWTSFALAFAILGLELGFLLAYRAGWEISAGPLVSNVSMALILLPIGLFFFKEKLSPVNSIGILVCVVGLVLINWKQ